MRRVKGYSFREKLPNFQRLEGIKKLQGCVVVENYRGVYCLPHCRNENSVIYLIIKRTWIGTYWSRNRTILGILKNNLFLLAKSHSKNSYRWVFDVGFIKDVTWWTLISQLLELKKFYWVTHTSNLVFARTVLAENTNENDTQMVCRTLH